MTKAPKAPGLDSTLKLLNDPYRLIQKTCSRLDSDVFRTRVFGRPAICMKGAQAASFFYDPEFTIRSGETHLARKRVFMTVMTEERIEDLSRIFQEELNHASMKWTQQKKVVLYLEMQKILTKTVCAWAGVPLQSDEISLRTKDLSAMFDLVGSLGMGHLRSRLGRQRTEAWISELVQKHREGQTIFSGASPAHEFSVFRNELNQSLPARIAAVEIINILRPMVAVSVYIVFAAHALALNPTCRTKILNDPNYVDSFVQEVRRFYPFFPSSMAIAKKDFQIGEYLIPKGIRLFLDLYGTNQDPRQWKNPNIFQPERFATQRLSANNFIPVGEGGHYTNLRCSGENPTVRLMKIASDHLVRNIEYQVPRQNLEINFSRLPALPKSCFIISDVKLARNPMPYLKKYPDADFYP
jgi:fatty-acid peroxygenase